MTPELIASITSVLVSELSHSRYDGLTADAALSQARSWMR